MPTYLTKMRMIAKTCAHDTTTSDEILGSAENDRRPEDPLRKRRPTTKTKIPSFLARRKRKADRVT